MSTYLGFAYHGDESPGDDAFADGENLAARCYEKVKGFGEPSEFPPQLLVLLASPKYLDGDRAHGLVFSIVTYFHARSGQRVPLIGSSVAAVLFDRQVHEHGAVLICLASRYLKVKVGAASNLAIKPPEEAFRDLIDGLGIDREDSGSNPRGNRHLLLFLPSRLSHKPAELYKKLSMKIDYRVAITGGVSTPPDLQFTEFGVQHGTAVSALIEFDTPVASGLGRSLKATHEYARVEIHDHNLAVHPKDRISELTREQQFLLLGKTVDDRSIATLFLTPGTGGVDITPLEEDIKDGELLEILDIDEKRMYSEAEDSIVVPRRRAGMDNPIGSITFQCLACYTYREKIRLDIPLQITRMEKALGGGPVVGGFFSGEIGVDFTRRSMLANFAGATLTFGDEMLERFAWQRGFKAIADRSGQLSNAESIDDVINESLNMIEDAGYPGSMISLLLPHGRRDWIVPQKARGKQFEDVVESAHLPGSKMKLLEEDEDLAAIARAGKPRFRTRQPGEEIWRREYIISLTGHVGRRTPSFSANDRKEILGFLHIDLGESRTNDESHKAEKQPAAEKHADEKKVLDSLGAAVESSLARVMIWTEAKIMRLLDEGMGDALVQSSVDVGRHLLMKAVVDALGGSSGSIRRRVGNQLELVPGAVGYETIRDLRHEIDLTDKSLAARAFVYNKTMVVNDTFHDPMSRSFRAQFTGTQDSDRRMREYLDQGGSYAAAPLRDAFGQKLGTVLIQAKKRWWFYKYHLRCLDAFGDRVRTVVDHLESTLPANFLLQIGDELPTAAHSSSLDHALKVLVQNFQKACQAQVVSLFLWEPSFERFLLYAEAGWKKSGWEFKAQYAEHEGWTGSVALEDEPHYEKDLREYKKRTRSDRDMGIYEPAMFGSRDDVVATASLGLPLKAGGKRLGVLIALRRYYKGEKPEPFVTTDQKVLIQAADRIAGYVSVLLLQRLERLEKEREERYRAINQAISAADGPESAPETLLCRELRGQYQAEQVSFYGKNLECLACEPGPPHSPDDLLEQVSRNLEPEFKRIELDEQERADPECRKSYGLLQRACIPLSLKTLLGIIDIRWHEDVKRTDHPLRHGYEKEMKALGAMIASVYQRYLTGSELKRAERDAAAWGGHKANIIDAMIAPAKQALHRCNNIDWLLEGLQKMIVAGDDLNGIKRRIKEIRFKTRQLPRAMRFLKEGAQPVRTHELVDSLVKEAMAELDWGEDGNKDEDGNKGQDIKVQFGVAEGLAVCVSRAWIVEAFYNIADNAIRAIRDKGKPGAFIISATATGGKARIVFKDSGVGMSDEELELVLKGSHKPKLHRTGVGLPLTRVLIAEQDGEFRVNSLQGFGTEAIVNLPLVKENGSCHIRQ